MKITYIKNMDNYIKNFRFQNDKNYLISNLIYNINFFILKYNKNLNKF